MVSQVIFLSLLSTECVFSVFQSQKVGSAHKDKECNKIMKDRFFNF